MTYSWDLIRSFLSVATHGSLSAAARNLGLTQPTIGRHIDQLEQELNLPLFLRSRDGMQVTDAGSDLVIAAQSMQDTSLDFERMATGLDDKISGTVRISANEIFGSILLPSLLAPLMLEQDKLEIEISVSNTASNLLKRDADIAIRMFRPQQNDLVARKICDIPLGLFAHQVYLDSQGRPATLQDLYDHVFLGFDRDTSLIQGLSSFGLPFTPSDFRIRSDSILTHITGIRSGLGIGLTHVGLAKHWTEVEDVLPDLAVPALELWIVCHADVRFNKRIRLVMDYLSNKLKTPYSGIFMLS